jgi:hypothetical protein
MRYAQIFGCANRRAFQKYRRLTIRNRIEVLKKAIKCHFEIGKSLTRVCKTTHRSHRWLRTGWTSEAVDGSGMNVELGGDHWDAPHRIAEASGDWPSGSDQPLVLDEKVAIF